MPMQSKPLSKARLERLEAKRDLSDELLQSVREMKAGKVKVVPLPSAEEKRKAKKFYPICPSINFLIFGFSAAFCAIANSLGALASYHDRPGRQYVMKAK